MPSALAPTPMAIPMSRKGFEALPGASASRRYDRPQTAPTPPATVNATPTAIVHHDDNARPLASDRS